MDFLFPPPEPLNEALLPIAVGVQAATLSLLWRLERGSIFPRTQALLGHALSGSSASRLRDGAAFREAGASGKCVPKETLGTRANSPANDIAD
jgi:hypothetical protein